MENEQKLVAAIIRRLTTHAVNLTFQLDDRNKNVLSEHPSTDYFYLGIINVIVAVARGIYTIFGPLITLTPSLARLGNQYEVPSYR